VPGGAAYGASDGPLDSQGRPVSGWWLRFAAFVIDSLILGVPYGVVLGLSLDRHSTISTTRITASIVVVGLVFSVIYIAYFALLNGSERGQTVGQMVCGIAVRDEATGGSIGRQRAAVRILALEPGFALLWLPVLNRLAGLYTIVAALSPLWDGRRQGFHDKAAHTFVVKVR